MDRPALRGEALDLRRMKVRYDRLGVVRDAWATPAASVIRYRTPVDDAP